MTLEKLYNESINLLKSLTTSDGINASLIKADNYRRVWARDSIIAGIAGIISGNKVIINGLEQSLRTLAKNQHELGIIPSNVHEDKGLVDCSYGSLVGRIDANTWFIIGSCLFFLNAKDQNFWKQILPAIKSCLNYLKCLEFNAKGWIYTPFSGNWADEYPVQGYTLYDNMLYRWAKKLYLIATDNFQANNDSNKDKTYINFWPSRALIESDLIYHKTSFKSACLKGIPHFVSFILPGYYDTRFDAAGNGLALMQFKISENQKIQLQKFLSNLKNEQGLNLIPAFWPVIKKQDAEWQFLKDNYTYNFKNKPYHFHNGGIWPVWMGLFCMGLANNKLYREVENYVSSFTKLTHNKKWNFNEYITSDTFDFAGKEQMGFTAAGIIFMYHAINFEQIKSKLYL